MNLFINSASSLLSGSYARYKRFLEADITNGSQTAVRIEKVETP